MEIIEGDCSSTMAQTEIMRERQGFVPYWVFYSHLGSHICLEVKQKMGSRPLQRRQLEAGLGPRLVSALWMLLVIDAAAHSRSNLVFE